MIIDDIKAFRESDNGKRWHQASSEDWFHQGLRIALLHLPLTKAATTELAAANHWRQEGADLMARMLMNLTEVPQPPKNQTTTRSLHPV